jgi:glutamate-1-semialdehyde 2,1-aminomutase
VRADIITLGKVIGGGMPVGAFGASKEIMSHLSPEGAIYQAGTLSGNPIAMSAGVATVEQLLEDKNIYKELEEKAKRLMSGFEKSAKEAGVNMVTETRGSMFGFFFNDKRVKNFSDATKSDTELFAKFHSKMLDKGVYLACSAYETGFISTATTNEMIDETIEACRESLKEITDE